jgi:predicted ABC-type transport system involved in lysophospholipase L1 biosynthesis ATPase subunit
MIPVTGDLALKEEGKHSMSDEQKALRSGSVAIVFFTALSSMTALAAAVLPFIIQN